MSSATSSGIRECSTTFEWTELKVMGLKLLGLFESSVAFFRIGIIMPVSKLSGTEEVVIIAE